MSERTGTCEYVLDPFDPSTWGGEDGDWCYVDDALNENGRWPCPHDAAEGEDLCIFHLPSTGTDDEDVVAAVLAAIDRAAECEETERRRECQQFIGAQFGSFVVRNRTLEGEAEAPLDLRHARFEGVLDGEGATVGCPLRLDGAAITAGVSLRGAELERGLSCRGASVERGADVSGATVGDDVDFRESTVTDGLFFRGTTIAGRAAFGGIRVDGETDFEGATVEGEIDVNDARIVGGLTVREATFGGGIDCRGLTVAGEVDFREATVSAGSDFQGVDLEAARLCDATLPDANMGETDLTDADLRHVDLRGANLERATLSRATLFGADVRGARLYGAIVGDAGIDEETTFGDRCPYDPAYEGDVGPDAVHGAVRGSASTAGANDDSTTEGSADAADIPAATPDESSDDVPDESSDDVPDGSSDDVPDDSPTATTDDATDDTETGGETPNETARDAGTITDAGPTPNGEVGRLRKAVGAYRLVEELARDNALPGLVSHSFVRRQDVHRRRFYENGAYGRWLGKWLSRLVVLYGESWKRLVATGALVVFGFALLYPVGGWLDPTGGPRLTYGRIAVDPLAFGEGLYFSAVTFVSLGIGDLHPVGLGRMLAAIEALVGATLLVLLVYVFARRGTR